MNLCIFCKENYKIYSDHLERIFQNKFSNKYEGLYHLHFNKMKYNFGDKMCGVLRG